MAKALYALLRYGVCSAVMLALLIWLDSLLNITSKVWLAVYYCLSLYGLLYAELKTRKPAGPYNGTGDPSLIYLAVAPFIWPLRLYELLRRKRQS